MLAIGLTWTGKALMFHLLSVSQVFGDCVTVGGFWALRVNMPAIRFPNDIMEG